LHFTIIVVHTFKISAVVCSGEQRTIKQSFVTDSAVAVGFTSSDCVTSVVFVTLSCLPLHCAPAPWLAEYVRVTHAVGPPANSTTAAATGTALCNTAHNFSWLQRCYVPDVSKTQQVTTQHSHVGLV